MGNDISASDAGVKWQMKQETQTRKGAQNQRPWVRSPVALPKFFPFLRPSVNAFFLRLVCWNGLIDQHSCTSANTQRFLDLLSKTLWVFLFRLRPWKGKFFVISVFTGQKFNGWLLPVKWNAKFISSCDVTSVNTYQSITIYEKPSVSASLTLTDHNSRTVWLCQSQRGFSWRIFSRES